MFRKLLLCMVAALAAATQAGAGDKMLRVGIIGCDTSHVVAFTKILNNPKAVGDLAGFKVVAAFPGGSPDIPDSKDRLPKFVQTLRETYGVEIVDSIQALLTKVDVVLLESVDGRPHLSQVIPVLKAGKLVFIDKPIAGSLADALAIFEASARYKTPTFSSSSYRFSFGLQGLRTDPKAGKVLGTMVHGPCSLEKHHPDLFWYGIHGMELLYTIMGTGCKEVVRTHTPDVDVVTGTWKDGRVATFRGIRKGPSGSGAIIFATDGIKPTGKYEGYEPLVEEICKFFRTGKPPVAAEETIEMFAFMDAADESKRRGGAPVTIESVLERARLENSKRKFD